MQTAENKVTTARDQTDAFLNFMPGQRLRRARELRGMTQEQAGTELNLSLRFIEAIESDNYDVLPGAVFARGYMRSYARLLHLDENDVVAKFDQALEARQPETNDHSTNPMLLLGQVARSPRRQVSRVLWMVSAGILILMVAGAFIWSSHESFNPGPALEKMHVRDVTEATPDAGAAVNAPVALPLTLSNHTATAEGAGVAAVTQPVVPVVNAAAMAAVKPAVVATMPVTGDQPVAAPAAEAAGLITKSALQIQLKGDAWIRVTDAQGHLQAEGLHHAGENLSVEGMAPWHVRVGNAENVTLSVQDKLIDLTSHTHDHVADLTIQP